MTASNHRNLVAKHSGKFNKSKVYKDRKKAQKRGYEKHRYLTSIGKGEGKETSASCERFDTGVFSLA